MDNFMARGAGGPEFELRIYIRLTSPSLVRRRRLLNETYNVMCRSAWMPCS